MREKFNLGGFGLNGLNGLIVCSAVECFIFWSNGTSDNGTRHINRLPSGGRQSIISG